MTVLSAKKRVQIADLIRDQLVDRNILACQTAARHIQELVDCEDRLGKSTA